MKAIRHNLSYIGILASALTFNTQAAPFETWLNYPVDRWAEYDGLVFGGGKFWRLRELDSGPSYSTDGKTWTTVTGPNGIGSVAYGNDILLIRSQHRGTSVTTNGNDWTYYQNLDPVFPYYYPNRLAFGHGVFLTSINGQGDTPGGLYATVDGAVWSNSLMFENSRTNAYSLSFANDRFFAAAKGGPAELLLVSPNGTDWTSNSHSAGSIHSVAFGAGKYVAAGENLTAFTLDEGFQVLAIKSFSGRAEEVVYANGRFVAVGDFIASSEDGIHWTEAPNPNVGPLLELAYGNGRFVAIGERTTLVSTNGIDWEADGCALIGTTGLVHADGIFVGMGVKKFADGSAVLISTNRGDWKVLDILPGTNRVTAMAYAEGQYLAAAGAKAYVSTNPLSWQEIDTGLDARISSLAYFQGRFWGAGASANGDGVIVEVVPGATWRVAKTVAQMPLAGIAASAGRLVAVGGTNLFSGQVVSSANGADWIESNNLTFRPYSIAFQSGRFVIGGHFAGRAVSTDGLDWVQQADGQESLVVFNQSGGPLIAFHQIDPYYTRLLVSNDGQNWERRLITRHPNPSGGGQNASLTAAAIGSRRFVAAFGKMIAETEPLIPKIGRAVREPAGLRLLIDNWTGETLGIETSDDLQNWSIDPALTEGSPIDPNISAPRRFYRTKAP